MKGLTKKLALLMIVLLSSSSCAIKVFLVDRQTVLEDEAAGDWPEFEKEILQKSEASCPTPFPVVAENSRKSRLFNVLNSELTERATPVSMRATPSSSSNPSSKSSSSPSGK